MNTDRIYQADDELLWYFNVRGNQSMGPFDSYHAAQTALGEHVDACSRRLNGNIAWPRFLRPHKTRRSRTPSQPRHT